MVTRVFINVLVTFLGADNTQLAITQVLDKNIFDITGLIDYLYRQGDPPVPEEAGDINNSGNVNIFDITGLIDFLYRDGDDPVCPTL